MKNHEENYPHGAREVNGAILRVVERFNHLKERLKGMPNVQNEDGRILSDTLQDVADGIDVNSELTAFWQPGDYNLSTGNPLYYEAFFPAREAATKFLNSNNVSKYPYSEGDDNIRLKVLEYIESLGIKNDTPYDYPDIRKSGLTIHNLTFTQSTSDACRYIFRMLVQPGDMDKFQSVLQIKQDQIFIPAYTKNNIKTSFFYCSKIVAFSIFIYPQEEL